MNHTRVDQFTKQMVVGTLCMIAIVFTSTVAMLALRGVVIPDSVDRNTVGIIGILGGMLIKTGVDRVADAIAPKEPAPEASDEPGAGEG